MRDAGIFRNRTTATRTIGASERSLTAGLVIGFGLTVSLLILLTAIAVNRLGGAGYRLERAFRDHNAKVELAGVMRSALRERALLVNSITLIADPFARQGEFERFIEYGNTFAGARGRLVELPLDEAEKRLLERLRELTITTQPLVMEAVELAMAGEDEAARVLIRQRIHAAHSGLAATISMLIEHQKSTAEAALADALASYRNTRLLMFILGGTAGVLGLAITIAVIRNIRRQARLLEYHATYDALTKLPNRHLFADRLQQAILAGRREKRSFALAMMDLDRFKEINDTMGHQVGDLVLHEVSNRVQANLRASDTVARLGGDEFALLLPKVDRAEGAIAAAQKILHAIEKPFAVAGRDLDLGASIGIAMFPEHGDDAAALQHAADAAMYSAKRSHAGFRVYSPEIEQGADDRTVVEEELRRAIANNELVLHYQPKISLVTEELTGVEALVRWAHPTRGLLYPASFIRVAEQSGLMQAMTRSVLRMALHQCAEWRRTGLDLGVSVNIAARNIQDPAFPAMVAEMLRDSGVPASSLELEITETAIMADRENAPTCVEKLNALGVSVVIDDFGTGYASMSSLKDLLVAKVKIDRSFVGDMDFNSNDAVVVRTAIELGHHLGLKIVAEGVENAVTWSRLKSLGCDSAQGFYLSRPLPPQDFTAWLAASPWKPKT